MADGDTMLYLKKGKAYRCHCGANVFKLIYAEGEKRRYECNGCHESYSCESNVPPTEKQLEFLKSLEKETPIELMAKELCDEIGVHYLDDGLSKEYNIVLDYLSRAGGIPQDKFK